MDNWNANDWQGKRKDQVEKSYVGAITSFVAVAVLLTFYFILNWIDEIITLLNK